MQPMAPGARVHGKSTVTTSLVRSVTAPTGGHGGRPNASQEADMAVKHPGPQTAELLVTLTGVVVATVVRLAAVPDPARAAETIR
jgi:hypothetical protein